MIRLVATDLDGTLWGQDMIVPEQHVHAIHELTRRGITVLPATSRRPRVVGPRLQRAGLGLPAVLVDGAIGVDFRTGNRFHQAIFDPDDAIEALAGFREYGLDPCVLILDADADILVSEAPSTCAAHLDFLGKLARVADLEDAVSGRPVYGFSVLGLPRERLEGAANVLTSKGARVMLYAERTYGDYGLIVTPRGISKWSGIEAYCQLAGIAATEVLAVGDGDNDVTMLTQAAVAVAVKGGTERALALADQVIDPPSERGWVSVLDFLP